jgi:Flp pilus assembly protein TadG
MRSRRTHSLSRRGAIAVEAAFVLPVAFTMMIGLIVIGLGIFRYQQVATLAREGARYASVHGSGYYANASAYATANNTTAPTNEAASDIYNNAIKPMAVGLDLSNLTYSVNWGTAAANGTTWVWTSWVSSSTSTPTSYNPNSTPPGAPIDNAVQVTVTYKWTPGLYIPGSLNLTSTSVMPMSY